MLITYSLPPLPSGSATVVSNLMQAMSSSELLIVGAKNYRAKETPDRLNAPRIEHISWRTASFRGAGAVRLAQWPLSLLLSFYYFKKNGCTSIIAQFPNNEFLILGFLLSKITGADFYPFMHNTFADNFERKGITKWLFEKLEGLIFARSSKVLTISDGLKNHYEKKYNGKLEIVTIRHSYNEDMPTIEILQPIKAKTFAMVGSINASNLDATVRLIKAIKAAVNGAKIYLTSGTPKAYLLQHGLLGEGTELTKRFSREELLEHLRSVDAVLLPHGFEGKLSDVEYKTIFPTKTIEYLLSGRPILAHCLPYTHLHHFLNHHQCAYLIDHCDEGKMQRDLRLFSDSVDLRKNIVGNARRIARTFHADSVVAVLRNAIQ